MPSNAFRRRPKEEKEEEEKPAEIEGSRYDRSESTKGATNAEPGVSLRDYFAARETLNDWDTPDGGMTYDYMEKVTGELRPENKTGGNTLEMARFEAKARAILKYIRADAMLEERQKKMEGGKQ